MYTQKSHKDNLEKSGTLHARQINIYLEVVSVFENNRPDEGG